MAFMSYAERSNYSSTAEAKRDYFLTSEHLAGLHSFPEGGFGNRTMLFLKDDLAECALAVHGEAGLRKKQEMRARRADKKLEAQRTAEAFERELLAGGGGGGGGGGAAGAGAGAKRAAEGGAGSPAKKARQEQQPAAAAAAAAAAPTAEDRAAAARLLAEAKRALKGLLTWDYLRAKNSQHGCLGTATLERVEQRHFALLIGRGQDAALRSVAKVGAWHSVDVPLESVLGEDGLRGAGGKYGSNASIRLGGEERDFLTFKYRPATQTCTVTGLVNPRDF